MTEVLAMFATWTDWRRKAILTSTALVCAALIAGGINDPAIPPPPQTTPTPPPFVQAYELPDAPSSIFDVGLAPPLNFRNRVLLSLQQTAERSTAIATTPQAQPPTPVPAVTIAGKSIPLPPDVWIEHHITTVSCVIGNPCPEVPPVVLARGESRMTVSTPSGIIYGEVVAPGEHEPFAFVKRALAASDSP
jgi:hypothetical protein